MKPADAVPMLLLSTLTTGFNPIIIPEHPMPVILPEVVAVSHPCKVLFEIRTEVPVTVELIPVNAAVELTAVFVPELDRLLPSNKYPCLRLNAVLFPIVLLYTSKLPVPPKLIPVKAGDMVADVPDANIPPIWLPDIDV